MQSTMLESLLILSQSEEMFESCLEKQAKMKERFAGCSSEELKYEKLIAMGKELKGLPVEEKIPTNLVSGCQSIMYVSSVYRDGKVFFTGDSDALISAGLASILIDVYNGEAPEVILKCPPTFIDELGIGASLTPSRANGLYSIHLHMKQKALKFLMENS
jgi:cysteine desulfuration protein SufE